MPRPRSQTDRASAQGADASDPAPLQRLVARSAQLSGAADRLGERAGTIVVGTAGMGKSALLDALVVAARDRGLRVGRITATTALAAVPFGAVLRLIDPVEIEAVMAEGTPDPLRTAAHVRAQVRGLDLDALAVDDAHLLDAGTVGLVQELGDEGVVVLAAVRRDGPSSEAFVDLARQGRAGLVELDTLTAVETTTLASLRLDARCDAALAAALYRASRGNPLLVVQLVAAGRESGTIAVDGDIAFATGPLRAAPQLVEVVRGRLRGLSAWAQRLVGAVAVAEQVSIDIAASLGDDETIAELAEADWLAVDTRGRSVRIRQPVVREAILEAIGDLGRLRAVEQLLAASESLGRPSTVAERLSVSRWRLELGLPVGVPEALEGAALTSLTEPAFAELLLRTAVEAGGGGPAQLRLAAQLKRTGRPGEAALVLGQAEHDTSDPAVLAEVSVWSGIVTGIGFRRSREALESLRREIAPGGGTDDQKAVLAALEWREGRLVDGLAISSDLAGDDRPTFAGVFAGLHEVMMRARRGQRREAADRITALRPMVPLVADVIPEGPSTLDWLDAWVPFVTELDCAPARQSGRAALDRLQARGEPSEAAQFAWLLGSAELLAGRPARAAELIREAADAPGIWRDSWYPLLLGRLVEALVLAGRPGDARETADEMHATRSSPVHRGVMALGDAAIRADEGDLRRAAELALTTSTQAARGGDAVLAVDAAYAAVRYGDPRGARMLLDSPDTLGGPARAAQRAHASALLAGSPGAIDGAASKLAAAGLAWFAVEARASSARLRADRQDSVGAVVAAEQVQRLLAELPELQGGLVRRWHGPGLTVREAEVARLAAAGLADRAIGERMGISVRTVHAHLANVYRKVGVHSRSELRHLFDE